MKISEEGLFTEEEHPFTIKLSFLTLVSFIEFSRQNHPLVLFMMIKWETFDPVVFFGKYDLSHYPVEILSSDKVVLGTDVAQGKVLKSISSFYNGC